MNVALPAKFRKLIDDRIRRREIDRLPVRLHIEGRVVAGIRDAQRPRLIGRIENAESRPDYCLVIYLVRQTDAWSEIVPILRHKLSRGVPIDGNFGEAAPPRNSRW